MLPMIVYIHGLQSTPKSFSYIKLRLPQHDHLDISYDAGQPMLAYVERLVAQIEALDRDVILVGHSLGGVVAVAVAARCARVQKIATLSSPLGGSEAATLLRWVCFSPSIDNIHPGSPLMKDVRRANLKQPMLSIVSTAGDSPFIQGNNDGVVTISSQKSLTGPKYVSIPVNHFEVLLCDETLLHLEQFIFG